ncbi:hypothetical protein ACFQX7_02985 [Luedemannella flava]
MAAEARRGVPATRADPAALGRGRAGLAPARPRPIITEITGHTRPGAIVLVHDGGGERTDTVAALRVLLPRLAQRFSLAALPAHEP